MVSAIASPISAGQSFHTDEIYRPPLRNTSSGAGLKRPPEWLAICRNSVGFEP
jgi:hypothetical protein